MEAGAHRLVFLFAFAPNFRPVAPNIFSFGRLPWEFHPQPAGGIESLNAGACLCRQVSNLGREVADLRQVMKRMVQLMETLLPSLPPSSGVCPAHCSPGHHTHLPHPNPAQSFPSPSSSQVASISMDTPMSLPSSPVLVPQQHSVVHHRDALRPHDLQMGCPVLAGPLLPSNSFALQFPPILTETRCSSSSASPPATSQRRDDVAGPIASRQLMPDQGDVRSGGPTQTELGGT